MSLFVLNSKRLFYGWWVVGAGSIIAGVGSLYLLGFTVFFLPISQELGLSRAVTSLVFSAARLEGGFIGPLAGRLIDKVGSRRLLIAGAIIAGVGYVLLGTVVHSLVTLFIVYGGVLAVAFNIGFFPAVIAAVNAWFIRRRTIAMSIVNAVWGGAAFVLIPLLAHLILNLGWHTAAVIVGIFVLGVALPAALLVRRSPESMGLLPDGEAKEGDGKNHADAQDGRATDNHFDSSRDYGVKDAIKTSSYQLLLLGSALRVIAYSAIVVHLVPILVWKGLGEQAAANMVGLLTLLVMPISLVMGFLGDRLDKRRLVFVGISAGALGLTVLIFAQSFWQLVLAIVLLSTLDSVGILNWSLLGEFFGRRSFATLRGIIVASASLGISISPVYTGWVWDRTGSYLLALIPFAIGMGIASSIYIFLPIPRTVNVASRGRAALR